MKSLVVVCLVANTACFIGAVANNNWTGAIICLIALAYSMFCAAVAYEI